MEILAVCMITLDGGVCLITVTGLDDIPELWISRNVVSARPILKVTAVTADKIFLGTYDLVGN